MRSLRTPSASLLRATLLWCLVGVSLPSWAEHAEVAAAKSAYRNGDFTETLARLADAERSPSATEDDLVAVYWYRAASFHAQGRADEAAQSLDQLLQLRPLYEPVRSETPPNLRALFHARREAYHAEHGIHLGAPRLETLVLHVDLDGHLEEASTIRVFARAAGATEYTAFDMPRDGATAQAAMSNLALWEETERAGAMEVVVEVRNARGALVARAGDALTPVRMDIPKEQSATVVQSLQPPPPVVEPLPKLGPPSQPAPAPAPPQRTFVAPWMMMAAPTLGSGGCCMTSFAAGITIFISTIAGVIASGGGSASTVPSCMGIALLACSVGCITTVITALLGTCTFTLLLADRYYASTATAPGTTPMPDPDDEETVPEDLDVELEETSHQRY